MTQKIRSVFNIGALILLTAVSALAQTGTVMPNPKFTGFDNNGLIIGSGRLCTYAAGTTTPQATYTDVGLSVANTNPVTLDPAGRATVFLSATSYKFVLRAAGGALTGNTAIDCAATTQLWSQDNVSAIPTTSAGVDVPCTAGEAITAGQVVYWSDGSGSKNAGQCYKADNANAYSSTLNWVGVAPNSIASGALGTVRIAGSVSGLSALTIGLPYYIGTAGAVTATAPAPYARKIGQADSATSLVVFPREATAPSLPFVDDFRLSLTTATCETTTDVTAATTLYLTPCNGNRLTLFDTSGNIETCTTAEISIAIPATTSQMYDVWAYDSTFGTCTVTLELLAWTNDTTRATAIAKTAGSNWRWTKSGNTSRMYVGSVRTTTVSGQTEDSLANRLLYNEYNPIPRALGKYNTGNYTYTLATWRESGGSTTHRVTFITGRAARSIRLDALCMASNATSSVNVGCAIGLDSTTAPTPANQRNAGGVAVGTSMVLALPASVETIPAVGFHFASQLEYSAASGTTTWYDNANITGQQAGIGGTLQQ